MFEVEWVSDGSIYLQLLSEMGAIYFTAAMAAFLQSYVSKPFDFVRVDFYAVKEKIYIGELTHYPGSGKNKIDPVDFDFELGCHWIIKPEYWLIPYKT